MALSLAFTFYCLGMVMCAGLLSTLEAACELALNEPDKDMQELARRCGLNTYLVWLKIVMDSTPLFAVVCLSWPMIAGGLLVRGVVK